MGQSEGADRRDAKALFLDALELEDAARARFLSQVRARDPAAAERVLALLAAHFGSAAAALEGLPVALSGLLQPHAGEVGATVGDYELLAELASGASGVVWRARQRSLDRVVALKVLRAGRLAGAREVERFRAEAEAVARLEHPNLVPVYEVGEHEGRHFFSMRFFEGGSLAERVGPGHTWEPRAAAALVAEIARAVHHAHQRGLLHRDLKPSNVLLDERGAPCVADFGVAARIDGEGVAAVTATLAGTPAYMAPEQTVLGRPGVEPGELTVTTDVWALGCILYELLAGRPPFAAESLGETLAKVRAAEPFPLRALRPDAPRDLETIILRCLSKEPSRRYAGASDLALDLQRWLDHEPILARRTGPLERLVLAWRRNPVSASLAALVLLLVVALAAGASWAGVKLKSRLRDATLGEARATRLAGQAGGRARALALLAEAAALRPGPDLRDEAIACLALTDLTPVATVARHPGSDGLALAVDAGLARLGEALPDGGLVVRSLPDGAVLCTVRASPRCHSVRFSRDGRLVAGRFHAAEPTQDASVHVWSVETGEELLAETLAVSYGAFDFDPSGRFIALGTMDGRVLAFDLASGERVLELAVDGRMGSLRFNAAGDAFAIAIGAGIDALELRAFPGGDLLHRAPLPGSTFALAWTGDDASLVAAVGDYQAYVYDARADAPRTVLAGHEAEVVGVHVSPVAALAATSSWDRTLRLWDLDAGDELLRVPAQGLGFSTDGSRYASWNSEGICVARVEHGGVLRTLHGHTGKSPQGVAFSLDGRSLATFGEDGALLWDVATGRRRGWLLRGPVHGVEFPPGGLELLLASHQGLEVRGLADPFAAGRILLAGAQDECDLSADGRVLAVRRGSRLQLLDPAAPDDVRSYPAPSGFESVAVSRSGTYAAGSIWGGPWSSRGAPVWRAATGELLGVLGRESTSLAVEFAPDESRLVLGDGLAYEVLGLPHLEPLGVVRREDGVRESPGAIAFSPDGALLALGLSKERVGLYDARTLEVRARLEAPRSGMTWRLAFSRDCRMLAGISQSNLIHLWDLAALEAELEAAGLGFGEPR